MTAVERVIATARAEIGYLEKKTNSNLDHKTANAGDNNWTKYARDLDLLGVYNGKKNGYAWCDMFVDWCFIQTFGLNTAWAMTYQAFKGLGAGCTYSARYYKQNGRFDKNPRPGDQIFFTNDGGKTSYHTGLVVAVDNTYVYTIEGNTSSTPGVVANGGCVRDKKYKKTYGYIYGYGHPNYDMIPGETKPDTTIITNSSNEKIIWEFLLKAGYNHYGVAGLMGNLFAESGLIPNNLQNTSNKNLGMSDEEYTAAVDNGSYTNFINDSAGYGIAQWTFWSRKKNLFEYTKKKGTSIGDLNAQLEFLVNEIRTSFPAVHSVLLNAVSVREASDIVLLKFEMPADTSTKNCAKRASYCEAYFAKYVKEDDVMTDAELTQWFLRYRKTLQDNDSGKYSEDARKWIFDKKLMVGSGTLPDKVTPNMMWEDFLTREQFATVLYRYHTEMIDPMLKKIDAIATKLGV